MSRTFTCEPNCPTRRPGCQDHCEKHQAEKAAYEARKAELRRDSDVRDYIVKEIVKNRRR